MQNGISLIILLMMIAIGMIIYIIIENHKAKAMRPILLKKTGVIAEDKVIAIFTLSKNEINDYKNINELRKYNIDKKFSVSQGDNNIACIINTKDISVQYTDSISRIQIIKHKTWKTGFLNNKEVKLCDYEECFYDKDLPEIYPKTKYIAKVFLNNN